MVCFDSDFIIDFLMGESYAVKKMKFLRDNNSEISTTSINTFELLRGATSLNQKNSNENVFAFLSYLKIFDFDFEASEKAAEIFDSLKIKGELIDVFDLMIASIVISNGESLLTRNISHFNIISGLKIAN